MMAKIELQGAKGPFRLYEQTHEKRTLYLVSNDDDLLVAIWDAKQMAEAIKFGLETGNIQIATSMEEYTEH